MADPKPRLRLLRFSLRSLLLVIVLLCVTLGWKTERARKQRKTVEWVLQSGGSVVYDYELDDDSHIDDAEPPGQDRLRNAVGIDFFADVVIVDLSNSAVTDVSSLAGLTRLEELHLYGTHVRDVWSLTGLAKLRYLGLSDTHVSDTAAKQIRLALPNCWVNGP